MPVNIGPTILPEKIEELLEFWSPHGFLAGIN
jgi:hypothetical protein